MPRHSEPPTLRSIRRVERRGWVGAGRERVSAAQDLRLRVRAPLKLSTSTSGRFVPANIPFSASFVSSCSFSSSSSRWRQSCRGSADQQETANDIKQERPRMPVSYSWCAIQPPQSQYPPAFLCVFAPWRLCVKRSGRREVQVETISTQSRKAQCLKFAVLPSAGFSSRVAQDKNHERHETHEKRVKIEQEAAEETEGSLPLLPHTARTTRFPFPISEDSRGSVFPSSLNHQEHEWALIDEDGRVGSGFGRTRPSITSTSTADR